MLPLGLTARPGEGNIQPSRQILASERIFRLQQFLGGATEDQHPSVGPGSRPKVQDIIRTQNRFFVVLHDQDGIAQIPEPLQCREQPGVVPLV